MNYIILPTKKEVTLPERGYFKLGDSSEDIEIISTFLATNFMGYEYKLGVKIDDMLGDTLGNNLVKWIKFFQEQNNLEVDGNIGPITLSKLKEFGL